MYTKFAAELFEWVAPYAGASSGIGLAATKDVLKVLSRLVAKHNISVGNYDLFAAAVMTMSNNWAKTSDRPYTDHQKSDFIRRAARIAKRSQGPIDLEFDIFFDIFG